MKMHHKLIALLVLISITVFFVAKLSIWFMILLVLGCVAIPIVTHSQNLLKIFVPFAVILCVIIFVMKIPDLPSQEELRQQFANIIEEVSRYEQLVIAKENELAQARKDQGWFRSTFNDSEKVNRLKAELKRLQKEKTRLDDQADKFRRKIAKKDFQPMHQLAG